MPPFVVDENSERSHSMVVEESSLTSIEIADTSNGDSSNSVR